MLYDKRLWNIIRYIRYNNRNILTDFTLRIPQNSKIGIIGESGMGKTTIIKLLMGYYDTYEGNIKIGEKINI